MPGIESRLALLYTFGVAQGRLSLARWIDVCCAAPARMFGLAGRKGALTAGADADVVIFDPEREVTISRSILHENCDYTPYDGFHLGAPRSDHAAGPRDRAGWRIRRRFRRRTVPDAGKQVNK